jgi:hypothetical protein
MRKIGDTGEDTQATATGVDFDQVIANALAEDGILPSYAHEWVIEQARLETDNYTSDVFLQNNNINGYNYDNSQWQDGPGLAKPASEGGGSYGNYDSVENSVHETSYWWQRRAAAGFDLTSLTTRTAFVAELVAIGWFTSGATAYTARMAAVSTLIAFQASTGIITQGVSNTVLIAGVVALGFIIFA